MMSVTLARAVGTNASPLAKCRGQRHSRGAVAHNFDVVYVPDALRPRSIVAAAHRPASAASRPRR